MLTPAYLSSLPEALVDLFGQAEADILADMARRISTYDYFIPAAEHQMRVLEEMGMVREEIVGKLSGLTGKTDRELSQLMRQAGVESLKSDDEVYRRAGLNPPPMKSSKAIQKLLNGGLKKTHGQFTNLTKTTAKTAGNQFERALDRAYMQITMGGMDYNTAVRSAVKDLSKQGLESIRYPTGKTDSLETAVRRATVTGVNQTLGQIQEARADEMGCDLVETTAHPGARPSHAQWQGQIFSRSGKSSKYPDFRSSTGYGTGAGLKGWNCSHDFRPYIEGMPRTYTNEMLERYQNDTVTYNGEKLTRYEAQSKQREIERNIRRWKREQQAMKAAGLDTSESTSKIREWQDRQRDFLKQTGLKRQSDREQIGGLAKSIKSGTIEPTKKPFIPAQNRAEAEAFVREQLKISKVSYRGCDLETINSWNQGLYDNLTQFPELSKKFGFVGECHERNAGLRILVQDHYMSEYKRLNPGMSEVGLKPYVDKKVNAYMRRMRVSSKTYAQSYSPGGVFDEYRGVCVNRDFGGSAKAFTDSLRADVESKWHPIGCENIRSVLDHEVGHQLDDLLQVSQLDEIRTLFDSRTRAQLTGDLSQYAWDNSNSKRYSEMIAEAWAEYCNNPEPREIAKTVGNAIKREYNKKFGKG